MQLESDDKVLIDQFLDALWLERGLSQHTLAAYRNDLTQYARWILTRNNSMLSSQVSDLQAYLKHRNKQGRSPVSIARSVSALRRFYRYCLREGLCSEDPSALLESIKTRKSLPEMMSEDDVELFLQVPDCETALGLRDRPCLNYFTLPG